MVQPGMVGPIRDFLPAWIIGTWPWKSCRVGPADPPAEEMLGSRSGGWMAPDAPWMRSQVGRTVAARARNSPRMVNQPRAWGIVGCLAERRHTNPSLKLPIPEPRAAPLDAKCQGSARDRADGDSAPYGESPNRHLRPVSGISCFRRISPRRRQELRDWSRESRLARPSSAEKGVTLLGQLFGRSTRADAGDHRIELFKGFPQAGFRRAE